MISQMVIIFLDMSVKKTGWFSGNGLLMRRKFSLQATFPGGMTLMIIPSALRRTMYGS